MNKKIKPYDYVIGFDKSFGFIHHIPSKRIVKCKTELAKILKESLEKKQIDEQVEQFLFDTFEKKCNYSDCQKAEVVKKGLSRLEIIITTACNLNCSYCYADGGNYGRQRMTMSIETADRIISFIIKNGDQIGEIVFLAGNLCWDLKRSCIFVINWI